MISNELWRDLLDERFGPKPPHAEARRQPVADNRLSDGGPDTLHAIAARRKVLLDALDDDLRHQARDAA